MVEKSEQKLKYVIVRTDKADVYAGYLVKMNKDMVELKNARILWYWQGAFTTIELANDGVKEPSKCKFSQTCAKAYLFDAISIIPASKKAQKIIEAVPNFG